MNAGAAEQAYSDALDDLTTLRQVVSKFDDMDQILRRLGQLNHELAQVEALDITDAADMFRSFARYALDQANARAARLRAELQKGNENG